MATYGLSGTLGFIVGIVLAYLSGSNISSTIALIVVISATIGTGIGGVILKLRKK